MLRELDYQARVLDTFDTYLTHLIEEKRRADRAQQLIKDDPDLGLEVPDYARRAWEAMAAKGALPATRANIPFSPRVDGMDRSVPNTVFEVPTGGGKTYLATSALSKILGRYLGRNTGFILWIVPNEAIYSQTLKQLKDRDHPYRQMLDRSAAGRVKIMEKDDPLNARDVDSHLCVMLLMLQSANRTAKGYLKMFQDRGDVHGFFPPEGDQAAHEAALTATPNLDAYSPSHEHGSFWPMVKDSLGNALRLIRPVVVMDEGHRAISDLAFATLYGFNPSFVLELTATPKDVEARGGKNPRPARYANVLVKVTGIELNREGMIKMPLNLAAMQNPDWHTTLNTALDRLNNLQETARQYQADSGRYIRPIMLVQVERTGADQRDGNAIHALDVKDWLTQAGLDPDSEIAIKTADTNDLNNPENQDLFSPTNRVRVIITKHALQEGWDNSFAYVLCSLAANSSLSGMTQLVGRILRQPHAQKTGIDALDECYVFTHHADTTAVVEAVKKSLEEGGLGDLVQTIRIDDESTQVTTGLRTIPRRPEFQQTHIYLPHLLTIDGEAARPFDYEMDVLYQINWDNLDVTEFVNKIPENYQAAEGQLQRISLTEEPEGISAEQIGATSTAFELNPAHLVRLTSDIIPNAWVAREIIGNILKGLEARGFTTEQLGRLSSLILSELRIWLNKERDTKAEQVFREAVTNGAIQFQLRADGNNWTMPMESSTTQPEGARQLLGNDGGPLKKNLFTPTYEADLNQDERNIAVYLDSEKTISWWHRNVARTHYAIQGWRRNKIYPDFVFAMRTEQNAPNKITILETKGDHLAGNEDTNYKSQVLELMTEAFAWNTATPAGTLDLVAPDGTTVHCELILMQNWATRLPTLLADSSS